MGASACPAAAALALALPLCRPRSAPYACPASRAGPVCGARRWANSTAGKTPAPDVSAIQAELGVAGPGINEIRAVAEAILERGGVPEARLSAEYLVVKATELEDRTALGVAEAERRKVDVAEQAVLSKLLGQRLLRQPVQHIIGDWDFVGITLAMQKGVLCPRPETEQLVTLCMDVINGGDEDIPNPRILDVGCGTGAIGLALLDLLPYAECDAIDIEEACIELAMDNAELNRLQTRYRCALFGVAEFADAFAELEMDSRYDLVVSNPPYIPDGAADTLEPEVRLHERGTALFGGPDGLDVVRQILTVLPGLLEPCGTLLMEVDESHPALIEAMLRDDPAYSKLRFVSSERDWFGKDRFVKIVLA